MIFDLDKVESWYEAVDMKGSYAIMSDVEVPLLEEEDVRYVWRHGYF